MKCKPLCSTQDKHAMPKCAAESILDALEWDSTVHGTRMRPSSCAACALYLTDGLVPAATAAAASQAEAHEETLAQTLAAACNTVVAL